MTPSATLRHALSSPGPAIAAALASGALYAVALPPLGLWWLGWIALAPLCVACTGLSAVRGAGLGLAFGATAAVGTSPWLPAMIGDYFEASATAVWPLAVLAWVLGGAIYHAVFGGWLAWASSRGPVSPFVVGAVWWVLEWARANALLANPWALLGYTQTGWLPAAQVADLFGPYGIGALLAVVSATVAGGVEPRLLGRSSPRTTAAVGVVLAFGLGYGVYRTGVQHAGEGTLRVGVVQGAIARAHRYGREHLSANLARHIDLTRQAARQGAELVVWPELALDFYLAREPALQDALGAALASIGVDVLAGGLGVGERAGREGPTNSVFLVTRDGVEGRYDKVRLMMFSETRPLAFLPLGSDRLVAGDAPRPIRYRDVSFGLAVCSEAMYPEYVRETVRAGAEVLVAPTVDSWFGTPGGARQQLEATAMRAIETRRFVLRPTATGISAVIDPQGRVVAEAPSGEPAVLVAAVSPARTRTLYTRIGDAGTGVAALAALADAWRRRSRSHAESA
jgi:apolipoprotein N-acyltransferase